jgi:hypothetical protein
MPESTSTYVRLGTAHPRLRLVENGRHLSDLLELDDIQPSQLVCLEEASAKPVIPDPGRGGYRRVERGQRGAGVAVVLHLAVHLLRSARPRASANHDKD